jgi:hypothetical protein
MPLAVRRHIVVTPKRPVATSVEPGIARAVHRAHATFAQLGDDFVRTERSPIIVASQTRSRRQHYDAE